MSDLCPHHLIPSYCGRCKYGTEDPLVAEVMDVREGLDPMTADMAEAFVREAGMRYMDGTTPEELAVIAAGIARRYGAK